MSTTQRPNKNREPPSGPSKFTGIFCCYSNWSGVGGQGEGSVGAFSVYPSFHCKKWVLLHSAPAVQGPTFPESE